MPNVAKRRRMTREETKEGSHRWTEINLAAAGRNQKEKPRIRRITRMKKRTADDADTRESAPSRSPQTAKPVLRCCLKIETQRSRRSWRGRQPRPKDGDGKKQKHLGQKIDPRRASPVMCAPVCQTTPAGEYILAQDIFAELTKRLLSRPSFFCPCFPSLVAADPRCDIIRR